MTSKERAYLRGLAANLDVVVIVGKGGITESVIAETENALRTHELIKCRVLDNSLFTAREACDELSEKTGSDPVQVIGSKFVLYKANPKLPEEKRISLR